MLVAEGTNIDSVKSNLLVRYLERMQIYLNASAVKLGHTCSNTELAL